MSIRCYFKPKDSVPDPKGSLSSRIPSQAIALANKEVEKIINKKGGTKKRGNAEGEISKKDSCMLLRSLYVLVDIRLATVQTLEGMHVFMGPQQLLDICRKAWPPSQCLDCTFHQGI